MPVRVATPMVDWKPSPLKLYFKSKYPRQPPAPLRSDMLAFGKKLDVIFHLRRPIRSITRRWVGRVSVFPVPAMMPLSTELGCHRFTASLTRWGRVIVV